MSSGSKLKKEKSKLGKMVLLPDSPEEENEHELSYYQNDRVKLMKEVLKIIKPKKIKSMAPDCIKDMDIGEINSMLLEELLGISNKRLKYIFNGQNLDEDSSSSTDPEEEKEPVVDVISLDDVSEDDFIDLSSDKDDRPKKHKRHSKVKEEPAEKKIKKEKHDKQEKNGSRKSSKDKSGKTQEENLMSVLELLELQARARAIRSQLVLEASKRTKEIVQKEMKKDLSDSEDDAVIIESPKNDEIVITSSESEDELQAKNTAESNSSDVIESNASESEKRNKIKLVRDRFSQLDTNEASGSKQLQSPEQDSQGKDENSKDEENVAKSTEVRKVVEKTNNKTVVLEVEANDVPNEAPPETSSVNTAEADKAHSDTDEIVINVDEDEMDIIIGS